MLYVTPPWLEVAVTSVAAVLTAAVTFPRQWRMKKAVERAVLSGDFPAWYSLNWRKLLREMIVGACIFAPFTEETVFRGLPIFLAQTNHLGWALGIGVALDVVFGWAHGRVLSSVVTPREAQILSGVAGLFFLIAGLLSGLLIVTIILHAWFNFCICWTKEFKALRYETAPKGTLRHRFGGTGDGEIKV